MAQRNVKFWKDKKALGSLGRLLVIYFAIGISVSAANSAFQGQAKIFGVGNASINISMLNSTNVSRNISVSALPNDLAQPAGVSAGSVGTVDIVSSPWDMLKTVFVVMFWPQYITDGIITSSCPAASCGDMSLISNLGYMMTLMFFAAVVYWIRIGA